MIYVQIQFYLFNDLSKINILLIKKIVIVHNIMYII